MTTEKEKRYREALETIATRDGSCMCPHIARAALRLRDKDVSLVGGYIPFVDSSKGDPIPPTEE
jgi:hypothetical protein